MVLVNLSNSYTMKQEILVRIQALTLLLTLSACATGTGANLNETASLEDLESRIEVLEEKLNQALKSIATAKIDASTALQLMTLEKEKQAAEQEQ